MFLHPFFLTPTQTPLGNTWAMILGHLTALLANHAKLHPATAPLLAQIRAYLRRTATRLDRLAQRWQSNTLPKPRPRCPHPDADQPRPERPIKPRLPTRAQWLVHVVPPTARVAGQLQAFLDRPDTRALVEAAPQAARLLRPLCRALGIAPPDWLRRPSDPPPRDPRPRRATPSWPPPIPPAPPAPEPIPLEARINVFRRT